MITHQSAGILLYRVRTAPAAPATAAPAAPAPVASPASVRSLEVFLVHPGGPFWKNKHAGAWTIPKGEFNAGESALDAAIREFREETGVQLEGDFKQLQPIRQKGGKQVFSWAIPGDLDPEKLVSNTFEIEWPRGSGRKSTFPEIDKGAWYTLEAARDVINPAQIAFLDELAKILTAEPPDRSPQMKTGA